MNLYRSNKRFVLEYFLTNLIMLNHNIFALKIFHIYSVEILLRKFFLRFQPQFLNDHHFTDMYLVSFLPFHSFFYTFQSFHLNICLIQIFRLKLGFGFNVKISVRFRFSAYVGFGFNACINFNFIASVSVGANSNSSLSVNSSVGFGIDFSFNLLKFI